MQRTRQILLAIPLVMAVALAVTVVSGFRHARTLHDTLLKAQAEAILDAIRHAAPWGTPWSKARAQSLLERLSEDGILCLAVFDADDNPLASAGSCPRGSDALRQALLSAQPGEIVDLGNRARAVRRRPPGHKRPTPQQLAAAGLPPPRPLLVEFQPRTSSALEASALRTLSVGGAAALALLVVAFVAWRFSGRAQRLQEQLERDRRLAALGEMAAVLSHEIRNPLAALKGHAQLLAEVLPAGGRERQKANRVVAEAQRLEALTQDLLSFVRHRRVDRREVDPRTLLREAAAASGEGVELDLTQGPSSWSLDPGLLHQALLNLLHNALQASPAERPPQAALRLENSQLVVTVRDFGEGLSEDDPEKLFAPFHTTRVRGTGLGLTVARRIVELHGGKLTAGNHADGGAVFRMVIPKE